jgi:hypothetical protein
MSMTTKNAKIEPEKHMGTENPLAPAGKPDGSSIESLERG